jgi:predicted permease
MSGILTFLSTSFGALAQDIRFAIRTLMKSPGFSLAATGCLALGIGATAAMYSQIQATIFRPVPGVKNPETLVRLQRSISYPDFEHLGEFLDSAAVFAGPTPFLIADGDERPHRSWGQLVSTGYFELLGVRPLLGRTISEEDKHFGAARICVISSRLWSSQFGGASDIVGRTISVNGQRLTIVGVTPAGFAGTSPATSASDIWIPVTSHPAVAPEIVQVRNAQSKTFTMLGRLRSTASPEQAERALEAAMRRIRSAQISDTAATNERMAVLLPAGRVFPVRSEDLPRAIGFPLLLVGLVLVMACGNVSHLVLARQINRQRELAIRLSLGARRARILQICMTETAILSVAGAVGGLLLALWFLSFVRSASQNLPSYIHLDAEMQWGSLLAAVAAGSFAAFLSGLLPAYQATRVDLHDVMKSRGATTPTRGWFSFRNVLVFQQVCASMVLLLLTSFVVFGWYRAAGRNLGYDPKGLYLIKLDPIRAGLTPERSGQLIQRILERLRGEPWVGGASVAYSVPVAMSSGDMMMGAKVDLADGTRSLSSIRVDSVGEGFFRNLGVRLMRGREFTANDESSTARVVVVNETMAKRTWPGDQALGKNLRLGDDLWEVIGIAGDLRSAFLLSPDLPAVYRPAHISHLSSPSRTGVTIAVRVLVLGDIPSQVTRLLDSVDPSLRGFEVTPVSDEVEMAAFFTRFALFVYGGMGLFGLILACVGLAGVTTYAVARRTAEIGIRTALGATPFDIVRLIVGQSAGIIALGVGIGLLAALALLRVLGSFVETFAEIAGFSASDPLILLGAPLLLGCVALLAAIVPAMKALRIEAAEALRLE